MQAREALEPLSRWVPSVPSSGTVEFPFRFSRSRKRDREPEATEGPRAAAPVVGDAAEFQRVVASCQAKLEERARFLCRGRSPSDATDLLQDTYERAFRAFHTYDRNAPPLPWLASILVRRFLDLCRHDKRHPEQEFTEALDRPREEDEPAEAWGGYTLDDVWRAVELLPQEFRDVVRLKDMEGLSYAQIGQRLGIAPMTVGTRLFRARKKLKELLLKQAAPEGGR
ncbi:RNA polymerase sigma-70 factor, ECF subfamily [Stigmatella aurantiaca]|uniref:RNA polymerase sigma-70 factor, ECF subfamily n=1 Tax=Stigmatella aurantiaca TaxID=41 RepID=A0A1H7G4X2_STIAU|nr:RNA polymerase sigma-70 factor, ECF subfamily [Stigmatella aurantiaca]